MTTISTSTEHHAVAARSTKVIATAWLGTLLLSKLPLVIARDVLGTEIPWIIPTWIVTAILLIAAAYVWPALKPLRAYFAIMGVIIVAPFVLRPLILQSSSWRVLIESQTQVIGVFGDRILLVLDALIVLFALFLLGVKRRDAFLAVGNLKAPVGGESSLPRKRRLPWFVFGTVITALLGAGFFYFMASQSQGWSSNIAAVLPWIPLILLSAALNAFGEEAQFRAAPLATLIPAVGPTHALWMTSIWFGLGHYIGGTPSGPFGFVQTGLIALIMGKAMIDTRGFALPWAIHVILDTIIYFFIAATI